MEKYILIKGNGPILITAPHVVNTMRQKKVHLMEYYIYIIVNKLYDILGKNKCTLITWNQKKIKNCDINVSDPNYKKENQHTWINIIRALHDKKKFSFHLDFHGMRNHKTANIIDLGLGRTRNGKKKTRTNCLEHTVRHRPQRNFTKTNGSSSQCFRSI
jgi:hypothetical protein